MFYPRPDLCNEYGDYHTFPHPVYKQHYERFSSFGSWLYSFYWRVEQCGTNSEPRPVDVYAIFDPVCRSKFSIILCYSEEESEYSSYGFDVLTRIIRDDNCTTTLRLAQQATQIYLYTKLTNTDPTKFYADYIARPFCTTEILHLDRLTKEDFPSKEGE